ncbi:serine/threonine-protein phosphatase 6 regulatory ankyrin repeat subunit B-like [Mytilus edulis]
MASLSEEEENYVRLALLLKGVTPRAVRTYFDREFPPTSLPSTLSTSHNTLLDLKVKRIINQAQWNLLIPRNGVPDSKTFDVTLMICLIRNLTSINPPINGFDSLPLPGEITPGPDLARIKCYRNKLAHQDSNTIDTTYFNTAWRDISEAVGRLGGQTMYQECQGLKVKILDQSNQEIMLEIKHSLEELKELKLAMEILKDPIPWHIKELIKKQIEDWEKKDNMFVSTRASDYVMEQLQDNSCLTLTAPSGVGKSFIARHTALLLKKEGYNIIPVYLPTDIRDYYQPDKQTVFIVDDICGNFTANQQQIDNWKQLLPVINTIIADKCCKIIVSCRLQVYKDNKFKTLSPFKSCECNLISAKLCLTSVEKTNIAKTYISTSMTDIDDLSFKCDFFPLLCSLYHEKEDVDVKEYFKNPFDVYKRELDRLSEHGDEGNYKICSLALSVLFNNQLSEKWFQGKVTNEQQNIIEDTCDACKLNRSTSKAKLKEAIDTLDGTFIYKQNGIYRTVHDKLFDFLAHYFGQKMIECLIDHGDSDLVHARFTCQKSSDDKNSNIDFIIEIPDDYLESYLQRFIKDWSTGKVSVVFSNINMEVSSFRQKLLQYLLQLDKPQQVTLANTKDTVEPKESCASGTTPLVWNCYDGYTDMVQWMLHNDVDVDQCRDDEVTGLIMASMEGHSDIVKLLLERNPNVDLCNNDGCSPLFWASQEGHTDVVKLLLERNPNVDLCNKDGRSPLLLASNKGHTDIVKLLLERNPNVDLCDKDGCSPLYMASQQGHSDIVKLLLERNPNVNLCDNNGNSPLYWASYKGYTEIVKLLLERNPNVDLCDNNGCSPLYWASYKGYTDIVKLLLERNPNVNLCDKDSYSPLLYTSSYGQTDIVKLLLERNPNVDLCDNNGCSPLYWASQEGYTDIVKLLLERNPNVDLCDKDGCSPLYMASQQGHSDIVKLLLERNPNVNLCDNNGNSPLYWASYKGYTEIVKLLLERNPNVDLCDNNGCSPLYWASYKGYTDIVKLLLERNPNVNLCDKDSYSPLLYTSSYGQTDIVKLLLERNPNVDLCDNNGCSPLYWASQEGYTDIVKLLLERNPNVNLCDKDGWSPLYMASQEGHTEIVKLLLEKNPNVNLCDKDGCSPLYWASYNGHTDIVKLLLERNPNVDLCSNDFGFTPLIYACSRNHISIVQLLLKHKPDINAQTDDGGNALYFSALNGYIDITRLLLENNADCNICMHSKQSIADTYSNHPRLTLDEERQEWFDFLLKTASSNVRDYISDKTVDYGFDVVVSSSPLHIACFMGRTDVVHCLLKYHVNINMTKEDGTTPLFYACEVGHEDIVRLLLDKGADTKIYRLDGASPLTIATDNGHTSIVMMLTNHTKKEEKLSS